METSGLFGGSSGNNSQLQYVATLWICWLADHSNYMFFFLFFSCLTNSFYTNAYFLGIFLSRRKINLFKGNKKVKKKCFQYLLKKIVWINLLFPRFSLVFLLQCYQFAWVYLWGIFLSVEKNEIAIPWVFKYRVYFVHKYLVSRINISICFIRFIVMS